MAHTADFEESDMHRKRNGKENTNGNLETSFTSIVWILEIINRTLVYRIFLLKVEKWSMWNAEFQCTSFQIRFSTILSNMTFQ